LVTSSFPSVWEKTETPPTADIGTKTWLFSWFIIRSEHSKLESRNWTQGRSRPALESFLLDDQSTCCPGSSFVVVNTAMQPVEPPQRVVAAKLPGTYTWFLKGSAATEWEPAAVVGVASSASGSPLWSTTPSIGPGVGKARLWLLPARK